MTSTRSVTVAGGQLAYTDSGSPVGPALVLLHGWPQTRGCWDQLSVLAAPTHRVIAFDLPGIGDSESVHTDGTKHQIAAVLHEALAALGVAEAVFVGHDIGGMVVYDYIHHYDDAARAVILDAIIPGIDPWDQVMANPRLWHFAFHATPSLPETLVRGRELAYFSHFFDLLTHPDHRIPEARQKDYTTAYATPGALTAGFDLYRALPADSEHNRKLKACPTPLLYLRGAHGIGKATTNLVTYRDGLVDAGNQAVTAGLIPDSVHYLPEENPASTWQVISDFIND